MCGIFGAVKRGQKINIDNFKRINALQHHRGPDENDVWISENGLLAVGHNRLSIIDLKQGQQPMANKDRSRVIVYNGEIYNYLELKSILTEKGYTFTTTSDTEVVLNAYAEWGPDCVNHFRGMFAFGVIDNQKQEVFLARDFVGIKPLVYYSGSGLFCFASEIGTLAAVGNIDLEIDYNAVDLYLWMQYIPAPKTVFTKIKKLEPGCRMRVGFDGVIKSYDRYWRLAFKPVMHDHEAWAEKFEDTISRSVKSHTVADVAYGAFLSGGLDSSLIVKYLVKSGGVRIKTFSIGFDEPAFNELDYSRIAAKKFNTDHYARVITADDYLSIFEKLVSGYGEPFGDSSAVPTYFVSELAGGHVKTVLSGDGGDELFGGYNSYVAWLSLAGKKANRPWHMNFARYWLSVFFPRRFVPEKHNLSAWLNLISYYKSYQREKLWKKEYRQYISREYNFFGDYKKEFRKLGLVNKAQLFDLANYLPYDILTKVDIASMLNSVECRVPFLDKEVIEMALSIPENINRNSQGRWEGKSLMKANLAKDFSTDFIHRQKQGFGVPLAEWFAENGPLYNEPYMKLMNSRSKIFCEMFDLQELYYLLAKGDHNSTYLLLFLEEWLYQFENRGARIII